MRQLAVHLGIFAMVAACACQMAAAGVGVSPLRLELPPDGRSEVIRLHNPSQQATLVKIQAITWAEGENLDAAPLAPEILALPPIVRLEANSRQLVRVAFRQPLNTTTEQAYRLLITEVPTETDPNLNGLSFAVRMNLPVFVTPAGAAPDPVWTLRNAPDGATELVLRNEGQAHLRVSKLALQEPGRMTPILTIDQGTTTLPGKEHRWLLEHPAHALPHRLEVRAETPRGELVMPLSFVRE